MRLYYAFVTGISGWIGVSYYEYLAKNGSDVEVYPGILKKVLLIIMLFLGWGVNQIINDYLGQKEDRINAPDRPMVSGELNPKAALTLSFSLLIICSIIAYRFLTPIGAFLIWIAVISNIVYQFSKAFGVWANITFGFMIAISPLIGFYSMGPTNVSFINGIPFIGFLFVALVNGILTYYTYFKDYIGDKEVGQKTLVVKLGLEKARWLSIILSILPVLFVIIVHSFISPLSFSKEFILLGLLTVMLYGYNGYLYFRYTTGSKTYSSLKTNFRAGVCAETTLITLINPWLGVCLFIVSYMFIGFLFSKYKKSS